MAFSLSDLLNPAPASGAATPVHEPQDAIQYVVTCPPNLTSYRNRTNCSTACANTTSRNATAFAPELFEGADDGTLAQAQLAALAADATSSLATNALPIESTLPIGVNGMAQLEHQPTVPVHNPEGSQYPLDGLADGDTTMHSVEDENDLDSGALSQQKSASKEKTKREKVDKDKPSKHSSKNEGQHTDKRYLCYHCNKLFTRRRSVRDHIAKIHNVKSWEPVRSLEVVVEPLTGEPIEALEDIIARGPPQAPEKPAKSRKTKDTSEERDAEAVETEPSAEQEPADTAETQEPDLPPFPEASPAPDAIEPEIKPEEPEAAATIMAAPANEAPTPPPIIGQKRQAPESSKPLPAAMTKKGTAKPKAISTPNKRQKLSKAESITEKEATRSPSATPASMHKMPSSKLKKQISAVSVASSPTSSRVASEEPASPSPSAATPASSNDDGEIFCICRKGDNHSWMIACDGVCEDWYHGKCVSIRERDGDLIDKYICPNCTRAGLHTTWKRMCRRKGCRKPARVFQDPPSKYCSKECGRMFFVELIRRGDPFVDTMKNDQYVVDGGRPKKLRKKQTATVTTSKIPKAIPMVNGEVGELIDSESRLATPAYSGDEKSEYETDDSADEDQLPNRGGPLRAGEVKAITDRCETIDQWRELGRKPDTPPREPDEKEVTLDLDEFERARLKETEKQKADLERHDEMLSAREKLLEMVKVRSSTITDEVKKTNSKMKDVCGFDPRLGWSEEVFSQWYTNQDGKQILDSGKIGPPEEEDDKMVNGVDEESEGESGKMPKKGGVCIRNRCPRHRQWAKGGLAEIRFEQDIVRRGLRRCEEQERGIREHAVVKAWEAR